MMMMIIIFKVLEKCKKSKSLHFEEKENILNSKNVLEEIKKTTYLQIKEDANEIKCLIQKYIDLTNQLIKSEEEYIKKIEDEESKLNEQLLHLTKKKEIINEMNVEKDNIKNDLELKINDKIRIVENLKKLKSLTISIEACFYIKNKRAISLEENLRELEDSTECLAGMISLENSGILLAKSEYARINDHNKNILMDLENQEKKIIDQNKEYKNNIENMRNEIINNKKELIKLKEKENDYIVNFEKLNEIIKQKKNKITFEESNLNNIRNAINAIENQLIKEDEKNLILKFCWKNNLEFNIDNILNDNKIISEINKCSNISDVEVSFLKKENNELKKIKSNLMNELEIVKKRMCEQDIVLEHDKKIETELEEKITNLKRFNSELLQLQRELSNSEEILQEKKKKLIGLKEFCGNNLENQIYKER